MVADELFGDAVELECGHSGLNVLSQLPEGCPHETVGLAHEFYFILSLEKDVHSDEPAV